MITEIEYFIGALEVGEPVTNGDLSVFPIFNRGAEGPSFTLASEAIQAGLVSVEEKGEGGSVPVLVLINKSETHVLITDGDSLVGGKQNRIVNVTMLVGPKSVVDLPVSCVEAGRWNRTSRRFAASEKASYLMRRAMHVNVKESLRRDGTRRSDQGEVWEGVRQELAFSAAVSPTVEMHAAYAQKRGRLKELAVPYIEGASGMIAAVGGKIAFAEVFARSEAGKKTWDTVLRSAAIRAGDGEAESPGTEEARDFLAAAGKAGLEAFPSAAIGTDVRLTGDKLEGSALVADGAVVHFVLFAGQAST